jgi:predicted MFS family arabinose efflux permease
MQQRWRSLAALTLARVAMGFQFQSVAALAPLLAPDLALDKTQLGWLIGLYLLPGAAVALPGGLLGKRFGDTRTVLAGLLLMAVGGLGLAFAQSFAQANAARLVSGIGAVVLNVLVTKIVADCFDGKQRLLAMSIMINAWPIGIALALLVAAPLGAALGWPWGFGSAALLAAIGFALVLALHRAPAAAPDAAAAAPAATMTPREWRLLLVASLPWLLYNAAFQIVLSFLPSFFVDGGSGIAAAGSLVALNAAMFVVGVQVGGVVLERSRRRDRVCHVAIAAWCATLALLAAGSAPLPWLVAGGLLGGLPAAAFVSLPAEFLRPQSRSVGMGVFFTVYYLGCALLPTLAGLLYDRSGGAAALALAAVLALLCVPVLWGFRRALARSSAAAAHRAVS